MYSVPVLYMYYMHGGILVPIVHVIGLAKLQFMLLVKLAFCKNCLLNPLPELTSEIQIVQLLKVAKITMYMCTCIPAYMYMRLSVDIGAMNVYVFIHCYTIIKILVLLHTHQFGN